MYHLLDHFFVLTGLSFGGSSGSLNPVVSEEDETGLMVLTRDNKSSRCRESRQHNPSEPHAQP
jgi:hypothetical protein